jgi:hypothetical protein
LFLLFSVAAYGGTELFRFEKVADPLIADPGRYARLQTDSSMQPFVSSWKDVTGVATRARRLALQIPLAETPDDLAAIEQALLELAENSPTMASVWLALAGTRSARGASMEIVLSAFRMSALTASHEGYLMAQRAIFGLEHWTELPDADRHTVVRDILATLGQARGEYRASAVYQYRRILERKPEAEREAVRNALLGSGLSAQEILQWLGV